MSKLLAFLFTFSALLIQPSWAQISRSRRVSPTRVIAGAIIGGLAILFLIILCLMMARRRRAGRFMTAAPGGSAPMQHGLKPMFGGPWGRSNGAYNGQNNVSMGSYPNQGSNYNAYSGPQHHSQTPYNSEYPGPNDTAPPPTYGQDADYGQQFSPPPGPPPGQNINQGPYTSPPGPPPAAHTTGKDNGFVGGLRS